MEMEAEVRAIKLSDLTNIILKGTSNFTINEGEKLYKLNTISNISGKKINNIYHIYGKVKDDNNIKTHDTHIQVDLINKSVKKTTCSCNEFTENSIYKNNFLCKHLASTVYSFNERVSKKIAQKNSMDFTKGDLLLRHFHEKEENKIKLKLDIKLIYTYTASLEYYEAEFRIGEKTTFLIKDLSEFIDSKNNMKKLSFNNEFLYNPNIHYFSKKDNKIIDFISEYIDINKGISYSSQPSSFSLIKGRYLRVRPSSLKRFLKAIHAKEIHFKHKITDSLVVIEDGDIPVSFTLKQSKNFFILKTKKILPTPLNNKKDVFLYNKKIYLPSDTQCDFYIPLYEVLKKNSEIIFTKNSDTLRKLTSILNQISKDILFDEGIKELLNSIFKPNFYLTKESKNISLKATLKYGEEEVNILSNTNNTSFRDFIREEKLKMKLENLKFIKRDADFIFIGNDEDIYLFLKSNFNELKNMGNVILEDSFAEFKLFNNKDILSKVTENADGLVELSFDIKDLSLNEFKEMFEAFKNNKSFYKTKKNSFIDLEDVEIYEFLNLLDKLNFDKESESTLYIDKSKANYILEKIENDKISFIKGTDSLRDISSNFLSLEDDKIIVPKTLNATLRDYQISGLKWFNNLKHMGFGGILADEMGLGKTIQTIAFLLSSYDNKNLIITPTSLIYNWKSEFEIFAPTLNIGIIHGDKNQRQKVLNDMDEYDVLLTTYGTLKNDFDFYINKNFDNLILDEAQNIKNDSAQNTIIAKNINAKNKFALTGTPIENNLLELWSIFDFVMPNYLYTKEKFKEKFINTSSDNLEELKKLIRPFILRRLKKDVIKELPDKIEKKFLVEMTLSQKQIYKTYIKDIRDALKTKQNNKLTVFSYLTKLRQLCLDPSLLISDYTGGSGKLKLAIKLVNEEIKHGKKILIFSQFTSALKNITTEFDKNNINYFYLDGSTKAEDRLKLVNEFNESLDTRVFLISLKAGGTGLNLTSANVVIHFDPWWNPAIENQATDRAHRIGQKNIVEVIKLISKGTIEEKILNLQQDKKNLINDVMNGDIQDGKLLNKLSKDDILELFS